jgi:hypothetical protein
MHKSHADNGYLRFDSSPTAGWDDLMTTKAETQMAQQVFDRCEHPGERITFQGIKLSPRSTLYNKTTHHQLYILIYFTHTHTSIMLLPLLLTALLPTSFSLPTLEHYNCGYTLTRYNSSAYVGLYAHNKCVDFFYNDTIADYQDAYAYHLYGGCECKFFG